MAQKGLGDGKGHIDPRRLAPFRDDIAVRKITPLGSPRACSGPTGLENGSNAQVSGTVTGRLRAGEIASSSGGCRVSLSMANCDGGLEGGSDQSPASRIAALPPLVA
jgi:hypothetical protein